MKARAVSIATAAGLAAVVFLVGALGHPGDPAMLPEPITRGASADAFLFPASGAGTLDIAIASLEEALTGLDSDHRERLLAAGFDAYLSKPVDLGRLLELLEAATEPRLAA